MRTGTLREALMMVGIAAAMSGCGGGGSDTPSSGTASTEPVFPVGTYAGTYNCAATSGSNEVFRAVLTTANGSFSTCSGNVDGGAVQFTCTGTISASGSFVVNKTDVNGVASTDTGTVTDASVSGTYVVPAKGIAGNFACTRS